MTTKIQLELAFEVEGELAEDKIPDIIVTHLNETVDNVASEHVDGTDKWAIWLNGFSRVEK
jgi:hypothetical protein